MANTPVYDQAGTPMTDHSKSAALKEDGNTLYRQGKVLEAVKLYKEASDLDPANPTLLSNLSAAFYELGMYEVCIRMTLKALTLVETETDALKSKLTARMVKSYLSTKQAHKAQEALSGLAPGYPEHALLGVATSQALATAPSNKTPSHGDWRQLIDFPRYRPILRSMRELFSFGHDVATSQFSKALASVSTENCSFLFGGIGDARHFYATLIHIADFEQTSEPDSTRKYHFTINDIMAPTLAKDIIMFYMLQDLTTSQEDFDKSVTLAAIFYIFCSQIMPPFAYNYLQTTIDVILKALDSGRSVLEWLSLGGPERLAVRKVLVSWKEEAEDLCSTSEISAFVVRENDDFRKSQMAMLGEGFEEIPAGCSKEMALYQRTAVLCPPAFFLGKYETPLKSLIDCYERSNKMPVKKIKAYCNASWKVNITLLDVEGERARREEGSEFEMAFNPFNAAGQLYEKTPLPKPEHPRSLYDYIASFFMKTAAALKYLRGRVVVEGICGELFTVMEKIRYNPGDWRGNESTAAFPTQFDRIHESNIPDYTGGQMSSVLYAAPLLKSNDEAYYSSTCLRNSAIWSTIQAFNNEYMLINDYRTLNRLFQMKKIEDPMARPFEFGLEMLILSGYTKWQYVRRKRFPFSSLLPKEALTKWLYALFLKFALPTDRTHMHFSNLIFCPLNLTVYFRVLLRLHESGYPRHWLATALANIVANTVTTSARPAETAPLKIEEVQRENPVQKVTTAPYAPEMSTLTTMFQPMLPFSLISSALPKPDDIHLYTISFSSLHINYDQDRQPIFALIFYNDHKLKPVFPERHPATLNWRPLFYHNCGHKCDNHSQLRENGLILWSSFKWERRTERASVWMRKDFGDKCLSSRDWCVGMLRTDSWRLVTRTGRAKDVMEKGKKWCHEGEEEEYCTTTRPPSPTGF